MNNSEAAAGVSVLPPELISLIFEFAIWSEPYVPSPFKSLSAETRYGFWKPEPQILGYDPAMRITVGLVGKVGNRSQSKAYVKYVKIEI